MTKRLPLPWTLLLCCIGWGLPAWGAPTTTPQAEVESDMAPAAAAARDVVPPKGSVVEPSAAAEVPNPSNTIKMLLELQATPEPAASASESGRQAQRAPGARPSTPVPAANPFGKGDNPFGAAPEFVRPAAAPGAPRASVDWQSAPAGGGFTGGPIGVTHDANQFPAHRTAGSSASDAGEQRWWMPGPLIRWVREHRQEVLIGAALALGLAWASASRASQRRR